MFAVIIIYFFKLIGRMLADGLNVGSLKPICILVRGTKNNIIYVGSFARELNLNLLSFILFSIWSQKLLYSSATGTSQ